MFAPADFLDLEHTAHPKLFENQNYVWDALKQIASYLQFRLKPAILGELMGKPFISNHVFIGRGTVVEQGAVLKGPAWIGENCRIRSGCYVRENVIAGDGVVMGNSCEFKNCILFDEVQVPHFNYVGDSILGHHAHLGAGVILSKNRLQRGNQPGLGARPRLHDLSNRKLPRCFIPRQRSEITTRAASAGKALTINSPRSATAASERE